MIFSIFATFKVLIMSNFLIYLQLKPFIAQWLVHSFGNPVRFPDCSRENACILRNTLRRPDGVPVETAAEGLTPICIPDSKHHPPVTYNYMNQTGKAELIAYIEALFTINWQNELLYLVRDQVNDRVAIHAYCERHGIDVDYDNTIWQRFNRWKQQMERRGLDFKKKNKNHKKR